MWNEKEEERQKKRKEEPGEIVMYSDGSKEEGGETASGVCRMGEGGRVIYNAGYRLGKKMEIMDTEIVGIHKAIEAGLKMARKERKGTITVRCDSQEAILRVYKHEPIPREMMPYKIRWLIDVA